LIALFDRIPYAIEQGKVLAEQGIDSAEQGILEFSFGISEMLTSANRCKLARGDRTEAHPS
jgi:hypothetical protein